MIQNSLNTKLNHCKQILNAYNVHIYIYIYNYENFNIIQKL